MMLTRTSRCLLLATAATILSPSGAFAQDAAAADEAVARGDFTGEVIIVTARKREESLQDVPISIQAFSSETLSNERITQLSEVISRIPGLTLGNERVADAEFFLRGIGSDTQGAAADGALGIFLDGVYMTRNSGMIVDLYDMERVEVLKGPQSLRFGKNVVGGLINYVTKKPGDTLESRFDVDYGNYNAISVSGSVRGPLSDTVSFGLTASSQTHDGFATNTLGGDAESLNAQSVRAQLRFRPNDAVDINISADYTRRRDGDRWQDLAVAGDSYAVTYNSYFAPPIESLPGFVLPDRNLPFKNADPRKGPRNWNGFQNADMDGVSATIDWKASEALDITSQTAYRKVDFDLRENAGGSYFNFPFDPVTNTPIIDSAVAAGLDTYLATVPDDYFDNGKTDGSEQFSQELRLRWDNGSPFAYEAGAYFLYEDISRTETTGFLFADFPMITEFAFAMAYGFPPSSTSGGVSEADTYSKNTNLGLFGEVTYKASDKISLDAGLRYAYDRKEFEVFRSGLTYEGDEVGPFRTGDTESWDAWLPSATIRFEYSSDATFYLRYARGYMPGGWTGENATTVDEALVSFRPEYANSIEAGAKLALADRRIRINAAAYLTKYEDLQTSQFLPAEEEGDLPTTVVINAENGTRAYGLELEVFGRVSEAFTLSANYAYTRCQFTGTLIIDNHGTDIDGNSCRRTPKNAFAVAADLQQPISDNLVLLAGANLQYTGPLYFDNQNSPILAFDSQTQLDARLGVSTADNKLELTAWVKNLTDELNSASKLELFGTLLTNYLPPRTYGVTARFRF